MLIRIKKDSLSKRNQTSFGVIDKHFARVFLKEGESCEVDDKEGKGYLANYPLIVEKVETSDDKKDEIINDQAKEIGDLKRMVAELSRQQTEFFKEVRAEKTKEKENKEVEEAKEVKAESERGVEEIETLRNQYQEKTGKSVPNQYKNNKEWILSKLV